MREDWARIYGETRAATLPGSGRHSTPHVPDPKCPGHCSGKHSVDGVIRCDKCGGIAYQVWSHEWPWTEGHNWTEVRPVNKAPIYERFGPTTICPLCKGFMARRG